MISPTSEARLCYGILWPHSLCEGDFQYITYIYIYYIIVVIRLQSFSSPKLQNLKESNTYKMQSSAASLVLKPFPGRGGRSHGSRCAGMP